MVKEIKSQMKAQFFYLSISIYIIDFLATFKRACDINRFHEGAAMGVFSFINSALSTTSRNGMSAATHTAPVVASMNTIKSTTQKRLLSSYLEVANYLLKKIEHVMVVTKSDSAFLCYNQPAKMFHM